MNKLHRLRPKTNSTMIRAAIQARRNSGLRRGIGKIGMDT
jgi:hypothetical protein